MPAADGGDSPVARPDDTEGEARGEPPPETTVVVAPELTPDQLFDFYERNNICEVGHGKEAPAASSITLT